MKLRQNPAYFLGIPQHPKIVHCSKPWLLESGLSKVPLATYHHPVLPRIFLATAWKALAILSRRHNGPSRRYSWPTTRTHLFAILGGCFGACFKMLQNAKDKDVFVISSSLQVDLKLHHHHRSQTLSAKSTPRASRAQARKKCTAVQPPAGWVTEMYPSNTKILNHDESLINKSWGLPNQAKFVLLPKLWESRRSVHLPYAANNRHQDQKSLQYG